MITNLSHSHTRWLLPLCLSLACIICWPGAPTAAQEQTDTLKIGILDLQGVMDQSILGKRFREEMEGLTAEKQKQITGLEDEITAIQRELDQGQSVLSDAAKREKQDQIESRIIDLRRFRDDAERELESKYKRMLSELEERILPLISTYGEAQGFTLILARMQSGLVYADRKIDVTSEIVRLFDAEVGKEEAGAGDR